MISIYTQPQRGQAWLQRYQECLPIFACILGFTNTGLIPGISAAGATPEDRKYTALADAEFLINGPKPEPKYPLPPLSVGVSPVYISRAVIKAFNIPIYLFNAGLLAPPSVPFIDLEGTAANCLTSGHALPLVTVDHLYQQGLHWGEKLAAKATGSYLLISECVVGGTTTALALLTGLGFKAMGKVNSSHPQCNHAQKWSVVATGLAKAGFLPVCGPVDPFALVAAVGDPMQIVAAGMAIAASRTVGVMLAGGTQMLAVYALMRSIIDRSREAANLKQVVVGTTRWVAEDKSADTIGLAQMLQDVPLLATQLSFADSCYPQLRVYEQGFVKEGVGAGGSAIAAHLYQGCTQEQLLLTIEALIAQSLVR
ncbi:nicotinate mononucleotide-dependent phosphoribosyltransferase CobT [Gloeothece verrucosa]|uniref:UPF0284 protein Cyan7822_3653 n=1 Tax=Gloeothece verrucosa (strain PCC 7822) TaxID=497965 RepID=E0UGZ1_GLOV7|nr:TIGR00303 family protein [Gloeothece verrucosa]ADN15590.1 Nicotinate-nucleotide-dimethylbenzimidazole phosphoribosyltransferase [Gloeothece verrucosa PCC 7822]